jgi:tetratricopeptide (TPR) repeat protein
MSPDGLLGRALARHGAGDLAGAIADYRALLVLLPQEIAPAANAATALLALSRRADAAILAGRIVRIAPNLALAHRLAAESLRDHEAYRRAWVLEPDAAETNNNFANHLAAAANPAAFAFYRHAIALDPARVEAFGNLAAFLLTQERPTESERAALAALVLAPDNVGSWNNLGNIRIEQRDYDRALCCFERARRIAPAFAEACINQGGLLLDLGRAEEGAALSRLALVLTPDRPGCYNNLANGELLACRLAESETDFRRALRLDPDDAQTRFNFAAVLLKQGKMGQGWSEYEWRRRTPAALRRANPLDPPDWPGGDPAGRTFLLSAEQGFGDALQFCRFAPWLAAKGAKVILRTHPALAILMQSLKGVSAVVGPDQPAPAAEFHLPLMSVPAAFALGLDAIPTQAPYLRADPDAASKWRQRLDQLPGRKVGLVWSGDPRPGQRAAHLLDRRRSMALRHFAFLRDFPDLTLISLQKGAPAAEQTLPGAPALFDWAAELADFADTAALISGLDLVISVDTAVAHLAGALGKPVWILSRFDGCWRWLHRRDDSPWYPTVRLFRQERARDWDQPLALLREALSSAVWSPRGTP